MPVPFSLQVTPTTTMSAVFSPFTFCTASREPGRYGESTRLAMTPSKPATSSRSSHRAASARSRVEGETSNGSVSTVARRSANGFPWRSSPSQRRTSKQTNCAGISAESLFTRLSAGWSRIWRASKSSAPSRTTTISPSTAERGGRQLAERRQLREVAQERSPVAAPQVELAVEVLGDAAEPVPLGLVLPAVALRKRVHELRLHGRERKFLRRRNLGGHLARLTLTTCDAW